MSKPVGGGGVRRGARARLELGGLWMVVWVRRHPLHCLRYELDYYNDTILIQPCFPRESEP